MPTTPASAPHQGHTPSSQGHTPASSGVIPALRPPRVSPAATALLNVLHTRSQPWHVQAGTLACRLSVPVEQLPFVPAYSFRLLIGDAPCRLDAGAGLPVRSHPALAGVQGDVDLPDALRLALAELLLAPHCTALANLLGTTVRAEAMETPPAASADAAPGTTSGTSAGHDAPPPGSCAVVLALTVPTGDTKGGTAASATTPAAQHGGDGDSRDNRDSGDNGAGHTVVPLRLTLPVALATTLAAQLMALPERHTPREDIPVTVTIEAGRMRLAAHELATLAVDDVLLPEDYPALRGRIALMTGPHAFACSLTEGRATVLDATPAPNTPESPMSDQQTPEVPAGLDTAALEVDIVFELERRTMKLNDLAALAPGYTFALGTDPLAPVTLRVQGRNIGRGRLVDLDGTPGVQVLHLESASPHQAADAGMTAGAATGAGTDSGTGVGLSGGAGSTAGGTSTGSTAGATARPPLSTGDDA
ncbi:type III secretion system cytoplasmic ring protein SctQ [Nitratidesulfovibrio vulgaris]|uniref:Type III secretion system apparatus protein YscQ/HrcQ n=1 Tax=Nitratidesulfovibrio vulgaris (strain DP4) TaxID=391774 RepID=A0A0H3ACF1_NITV4|nr:type III secretion system cytoplasmic ring protein SctQ [Nitratidesulfovibrio vulgaris]ABM29996.1 type III secretion system apparatus protein YscQ/HrcQ [Nitratidesulfovibrio vulgaris DP4]